MMNRVILLFAILFSWRIAAAAQGFSYKIDHAKMLFGLSSASSGGQIMMYSAASDEGEDVTGVPRLVDAASGRVRTFSKIEVYPSDASASWMRNGKDIVFESVDGIYKIATDDGNSVPLKIVAGPTHGLAISPDESKIAYWRREEQSLTLHVRNIATKKIIRVWKLPYSYGGEASGFEIAFDGEERLFAKTFDIQDATPLKEFDLVSGRVKTISMDCLSLAQVGNSVIYLAGEQAKGALYSISNGVTQRVAPAPFFTGMRVVGKKQLALRGMRGSAVFDTADMQLKYQSRCAEVSLIDDANPIYERGSLIFTDLGLCDVHTRNPVGSGHRK